MKKYEENTMALRGRAWIAHYRGRQSKIVMSSLRGMPEEVMQQTIETYLGLVFGGLVTEKDILAYVDEAAADVIADPDTPEWAKENARNFSYEFRETAIDDEVDTDMLPMVKHTLEIVLERYKNGKPQTAIIGQGPTPADAISMAMSIVYMAAYSHEKAGDFEQFEEFEPSPAYDMQPMAKS